MATTLHKRIMNRPDESVWNSLAPVAAMVCEWFWFLLSFVLFVVLGPFSAPIALIAIFKLGLEENDHREPESIS